MASAIKKLENLIKDNAGFCFGLGVGFSTFFINYNLAKNFIEVSNFSEFFAQPYLTISSLFEFGLPITMGSLLDRKKKKLTEKNEKLNSIIAETKENYENFRGNLYKTFENMPLPAYLLDQELNIVNANLLGREYLKLNETNYSDLEYILGMDSQDVLNLKDQLSNFDQMSHFQEQIRFDNDKEARAYLFPIYNVKKNLSNVILFLFDMTKEANMKKELEELLVHLVKLTTLSINIKDHYTYNHSLHVANYSFKIAEYYNKNIENVVNLRRIYFAGLLHDIGKIYVNDDILKKEGRLTDEEFKEMKKHAIYGYQILKDIKHLGQLPLWVRFHHENWDGTGYEALIGEDIPLESRILRLADVLDALTTDRPYRKALSADDACNFIKENTGKIFDPQIVECFLEQYPEILNYKNENGIIFDVVSNVSSI